METPNFIESYQTEDYVLCDQLIEKLDSFLDDGENALQNPDLIMRGDVDNGSAVNRKDTSINFANVSNQELNHLTRRVHSLLEIYAQKYAQKYPGFSMVKCMSTDLKVQRTEPKGGFHQWHKEHGIQDGLARTLVWTLYLNDIPEGEGETEFLEYGVKVSPKKGLLCFFPAGWTHTHRGNAVYSTRKYIATGWFQLI